MNPLTMSLAMFRTGMDAFLMVTEAQAVIAMRLWGLAGVWSVAPAEATRMLSEKPPILARAATEALGAAMTGKRPDEVAAAWLKPVARRTSANRRRLSRRGFKRR